MLFLLVYGMYRLINLEVKGQYQLKYTYMFEISSIFFCGLLMSSICVPILALGH